MRTSSRALGLLILILGIAGEHCVDATPAQARQAANPERPGQTQIGAGGAQGTAAEVDLRVLQFGVGNVARPGTWTGVQVQVQDLGTQARDIVVRLGVRDQDGDTAQYQATVATNPGTKTSLWLYPRLTFRDSGNTTFVLSAHEAREGNADERAAGLDRIGKQLGRVAFQPGQARMVGDDLGMIGVVGRATAGLDLYALPATSSVPWAAMANERVMLVSGLGASNMPDRWMGLWAFSTIVWTGNGSDAEPTDLVEQQAQALGQWVQRGGHLVVVLSPVGQAWTNPAQPLADIMPRVTVSRDEAADLNNYRPWLTHKPIALPTSSPVQSFKVLPNGLAQEGQRLIVSQDGKLLAVRRTVGSGAVTLVGVDVGSRALASLGAVQAEAFWNRVLGRRGRTPTASEIIELATVKAGTSRTPHKFSSREQVAVDTTLAGSISRTGKAALGLLLAFLVFAAYWVAAGPLGFHILRKSGRTQYAWLGFVLVGAGFTALAWTGAQLLRPNKTSVRHLTILDAVSGQPTQSARIFAAASLPGYGEQTFGLAGGVDAGGEVSAAVSAWEPPPSALGDSQSVFPDARDYAVATRSPEQVRVPARGTVKSFTIDWLGPAAMKMPLPVSPDAVKGQPPSITPLTIGVPPDGIGWRVQGALQHEFSVPLKDVSLIAVRGQSRIPASGGYQGQLQAVGIARKVSSWAPGELLVLNDTAQWASADSFITKTMPRGSQGGLNVGAPRIRADFESDMLLLSLFNVLDPPDTLGSDIPVGVARREGHDLDLSRWFTQPCLIVMGYLDEVPCPVGLAVDGRAVPSSGRVLVRWIYPLADDPAVIPRPQ
ncbi:MAG: hypothetical protein ACK54T_01585 [bacterium]